MKEIVLSMFNGLRVLLIIVPVKYVKGATTHTYLDQKKKAQQIHFFFFCKRCHIPAEVFDLNHYGSLYKDEDISIRYESQICLKVKL